MEEKSIEYMRGYIEGYDKASEDFKDIREELNKYCWEVRLMEYGVVKELNDGNTIWFEPITNENDGFVVRNSSGSIVSIYMKQE